MTHARSVSRSRIVVRRSKANDSVRSLNGWEEVQPGQGVPVWLLR